MSMQTLRALRLQGQRPAVVTVFIGPRPKTQDIESPALVVIPADAQPYLMDFRPLVGLWVALVMATEDYDLSVKVMDALAAAGAKMFGAACPAGTFPFVQDPTHEHHDALRKRRESLCL